MRKNFDGRPPVRGKKDDRKRGAKKESRTENVRQSGSKYFRKKENDEWSGEKRRSYGGKHTDNSERTYGNRNEGSFTRERRERSGGRTFGNDNRRRPGSSYGERNEGSFTRERRERSGGRTFGNDNRRRPGSSYGERNEGSFTRERRERSGGRTFGNDNRRRPGSSYGERNDSRKKTYSRKTISKTSSEVNSSKEEGIVRLNKFIANSGICSRREADTYIQAGLVTVNGQIITELGSKVNVNDDIRFNGERIKGEMKVYIVMNKPKNFVTTCSDPHAEKTVMDLISPEKCKERIFPVGRLDKATTGVLLFTNDGDLAKKLTHPSYQVKKIYHVFLDTKLRKEDFDAILSGIVLEDGEIHADTLSYVDNDLSQVGIEIHSGKNRIVRRIFEHFGYRIEKLDRVYFAGLTKAKLKKGDWRFLDEKEISFLKMNTTE